MQIYINNGFCNIENSNISANDRGLLLGDGIFTTIKAVNNKLLHFSQHYERLKKHAAVIALSIPFTEKEIQIYCLDLLRINKLDAASAVIRITLTRGVSERGINISQNSTPTVIIKCSQFMPVDEKSVKLCFTSIMRNEFSCVTKIKSLNYLEPILAKKEAMERGFDDGIMLNTRGAISECSTSNVFFVTSNYEVLTPHLSEGVLDGITRHNVINACKQLNIPILQRSIRPDDIYDCIEAFQTNCIIDIQNIASIEDIIFLDRKDNVTQLIRDYCKV